jgi:hypothetical protein
MKRTLVFMLTSILLVTGCGDSGFYGSSDDNDGDVGSNTGANITSANAETVLKVAYDAAQSSAGLGDLSGETGIIAAGPNNVAKVGGRPFASAGSMVTTSQDPLPDLIDDCDGGGTVTNSGDIADQDTFTLSPGDFFAVVFDMCNDGLGTVTDGRLDYVIDAFNGDILFSGLYDLTMTLTLGNFQVATAADVLTSNGDVTVTLNTLNAPAVSASISGTSLTVDGNASSETQTNFSSVQTLDASVSPSPFSMTSSGTLDSTQLSGVVNYSTPTPLQGFDSDYPSSGQFLVAGDNSSTLLTAEGDTVLIEIDADGDGIYEDTINTTWAELTN